MNQNEPKKYDFDTETDDQGEYVLVLRTCDSEQEAYGGFKWPSQGEVSCDDWDPEPRCGGGLHGFLWGEGCGGLADWGSDAKWLVVRVAASDVVMLDGKCKFPRGFVVYCGTREGATAFVSRAGRAVIGGTSTSGNYGTSTSGYRGVSTSRYRGVSTSGDYGTSTSGDYGTSTSGDYGTSTSGDGGTSTSGHRGTSTSGDGGTSTSGDGGTSTSGHRGILQIRYWDAAANRARIATAYVGEDGIKPNTPYYLNDTHEFVEVGA